MAKRVSVRPEAGNRSVPMRTGVRRGLRNGPEQSWSQLDIKDH